MSKTREDLIREAFYNPLTGFVGADKLKKNLEKKGYYITTKEIKDFLKKQEVQQISQKNTGKLGSFVPPYMRYEYQIDLIHLEHKRLNKNSYALVCIDTFSKKADVELLKRKSAAQVTEAMEAILKRMGNPEYIYLDEGSEFKNEKFQKLMDDNGIQLIFTLTHAPIVERFNRTLKEMLFKYLQSTNSKTITNVLPKILDNYNNSYHKTIQMSPNEVNEKNQHEVYQNILSKATRKKREEINVGDFVRVRLKSKSWTKGYKAKYSTEVYKVIAIEPPFFILEGLDRKYLRAFIQKVGEVEKNISPADLEGTAEGFLKDLAKRPIDPESIKLAEIIEQERSIDPIASRTRNRTKQTLPLNSP